MEHTTSRLESVIGRETEMRRLQSALRERQSQLIWGAADSGKTSLIEAALYELPEVERRKCICWSGPANRRQFVEYLIRGLYHAGDPLVRSKVHADRAGRATLIRWIREQSALRLRGILLTAAEQGEYRIFMDHIAPTPHTLARFMKEIIYRSKTPIYLTGNGYSRAEIGYAWSLYWTDEYRIHLGPLSEAPACGLLENCVRRFHLDSLDLKGFREEVLHLSGHLPGAIVRMCELAADPRYHYRDQVKVKLVHVDYLLHGNGFSLPCSLSYSP
jgi:hypothetical protein